MVTRRTDDKSRTGESNLAGENESAKIESFLQYVSVQIVFSKIYIRFNFEFA